MTVFNLVFFAEDAEDKVHGLLDTMQKILDIYPYRKTQ